MLMVTGVVGFSDSWWLAALCLPLATLLYGAIGPAATTGRFGVNAAPSPTPTASSILTARFGAFMGVLVLVSVLGFATLAHGARPLAPLPAPTVTLGPPVLSVREGTDVANCTTGSDPTVTITNISQKGATWSASTNDPGISVTPERGSLDPGASTSVTVSGRASAATGFISITFSAAGSQSLAKIACVSG